MSIRENGEGLPPSEARGCPFALHLLIPCAANSGSSRVVLHLNFAHHGPGKPFSKSLPMFHASIQISCKVCKH